MNKQDLRTAIIAVCAIYLAEATLIAPWATWLNKWYILAIIGLGGIIFVEKKLRG